MIRLPDMSTASPASKKRKGTMSTDHVWRTPRPQWHSSHNALHNEEKRNIKPRFFPSPPSIYDLLPCLNTKTTIFCSRLSQMFITCRRRRNKSASIRSSYIGAPSTFSNLPVVIYHFY